MDLEGEWHPVTDNISHCAGLLYTYPTVKSRWVSIPCDQRYKSRVLCEYDQVKTNMDLRMKYIFEEYRVYLLPIDIMGYCVKGFALFATEDDYVCYRVTVLFHNVSLAETAQRVDIHLISG